ncbi:hypothetical protein GCK32_018601, partial [Trichostrongylus colubriformis]
SVYSADLLYKLFQLTSEDTKFLDEVATKYNKNGGFDKASYYAEIAQTNTAVHRKMELWREIIRKVEKEDPLADQFLTVLMRTARAVRFGEVHQPLESNTILESFYGMPKASQEYLERLLPPLKFLPALPY